MTDYTIRIQFNVIEEYEFQVRAGDEAKATKALLAHVKNIENIDPWKVRRFDVQETEVVSCIETKKLPPRPVIGEKKRKKKTSEV